MVSSPAPPSIVTGAGAGPLVGTPPLPGAKPVSVIVSLPSPPRIVCAATALEVTVSLPAPMSIVPVGLPPFTLVATP